MAAPFTDRVDRPYLLIDYEWRSELDADLREQVAGFAAEAAEFDAEAGFTSITEFRRQPPPARADDRPYRLLVYVGDDARPRGGTTAAGDLDAPRRSRTLAAYLSIEHVDEDGNAEAAFVVAPAYRSRGIATLLAETLIADGGGDDWFGTGAHRLLLTAAGPHPASERLADRFGVPLERQRWELALRLREPREQPEEAEEPQVTSTSHDEPTDLNAVVVGEPTYGAALDATAPGAEGGSRSVAIRRTVHHLAQTPERPTPDLITRVNVRSDRPSYLGFVEFAGNGAGAYDSDLDALLDAGLRDLWAVGVRSVFAFVDPAEDLLVKALRRAFFVHDQTNLTYVLQVGPKVGIAA